MITQKELNDKYGTGVIYISPLSAHSPDGKLNPSYWCQAHLGDIIRDYVDHLNMPPTDRCRQISISYDGAIRSDMDLTDEELEWAFVEYKLREAMNRCFGSNNVEFTVTVKEN